MIISDRHAWSDESGIIERPKESVRLPSAHWEWDGDWMIDDNLRGEVVELGVFISLILLIIFLSKTCINY